MTYRKTFMDLDERTRTFISKCEDLVDEHESIVRDISQALDSVQGKKEDAEAEEFDMNLESLIEDLGDWWRVE